MTEDYGYDMEAIETERFDADMLQAQHEAESRAYVRDMANGICHHSCRLGRKVPAFYDADDIHAMRQGGAFPERPTDERVGDQASIPEGLFLCTDCGALCPDPFAE